MATGRASVGSVRRSRVDRATSYVLSTKVGRIVRPADRVPPGADIDHQALDGRDDAYYEDVGDRRVVFDYSADGVTRSLEESLARLGLDRVDLVYIHDPDDHWQAAIDGAYPALHRLREQGVVRAIGVGINQSPMLVRFARETEMDAFLVAGRYTLLDQDALREVLPAVPRARHLGAHRWGDEQRRSGRPATRRPLRLRPGEPRDPRPRQAARPKPATAWSVPLRAAAIQFPLAHPAVAGLIAGVRRIEHLDEYPDVHALADPAWPVG